MKQPFYSKEEMLQLVTFKNNEELKQLILENPEAPLLIFAGEEAWHDEWCYESCQTGRVSLREIVLTNPDYDAYHDMGEWVDKDDYEDWLRDHLCDFEQYINLSDEEYDNVIKNIIQETDFIKAICIYVG